MKKIFFLIPFITIVFQSEILLAQSDHILWYDKPGEFFEETLVLGNGKTGASVFGGTETDRIYLNDATLWSGGPVNPRMNPGAYKYIPKIREALKKDNYKLADSLYRHVQGSFSESYMPLGTMNIQFDHKGAVENYTRELNLADAVSTVKYEVNGTSYLREYFISHPDQIMVIRLTCSKERSLNFSIGFDSKMKYQMAAGENSLEINGYAPAHVEPSYRTKIKNPVVFDDKKGTRFTGLIRITETDGKVSYTDNSVSLKGAGKATILISIATSFNGFDKDPVTEGADNKGNARKQLLNASGKSFETLKKDHLKDYQNLYSRLHLELGKTTAPDLPTDKRLIRYAEGKEDKNLEILYFNYGRYLLISSSRTKAVPANLQGIWNPYLRPPWSSNYTLNINVEENYWLAEIANLSEMHRPLLDFIGNISKTGAVTAKTFYGLDGWTANHNSDIWAMSNPVGDFGKGDPLWANWPLGGAWLSTHLWEHYLFTQDRDFLRTHAYPLLKGAAEFCQNWLVVDEEGFLITSPSTSPENRFKTPDGYRGGTFYGGTADLAMIRECFEQTLQASEILGIDPEFRNTIQKSLKRLHPYQTGKKGNLQEWYYDWEDVDPRHRHQSHLFGLYPGHQITPDKTPELADACRKSLEIRGDRATGWSMGWRINLWARLYDGNHAYKLFRNLLKYVEPDKKRSKRSRGGGTYPNLFDAHPPFQIDGNFSGAAAVMEMLIQSGENEIRLLPALPDAWSEGVLKGVKARGGYELSFSWKDHKLTSLSIVSLKDGFVKLNSGGQVKNIQLTKGKSKTISW